MSALHREWINDQAERVTLEAPELRPVCQVPCTATSTGVLIGCAYRRPMPQAEIMQESLDYTGGPTHEELHALFLQAAAGKNISAEAQALLQRMATEFARINAMGDE